MFHLIQSINDLDPDLDYRTQDAVRNAGRDFGNSPSKNGLQTSTSQEPDLDWGHQQITTASLKELLILPAIVPKASNKTPKAGARKSKISGTAKDDGSTRTDRQLQSGSRSTGNSSLGRAGHHSSHKEGDHYEGQDSPQEVYDKDAYGVPKVMRKSKAKYPVNVDLSPAQLMIRKMDAELHSATFDLLHSQEKRKQRVLEDADYGNEDSGSLMSMFSLNPAPPPPLRRGSGAGNFDAFEGLPTGSTGLPPRCYTMGGGIEGNPSQSSLSSQGNLSRSSIHQDFDSSSLNLKRQETFTPGVPRHGNNGPPNSNCLPTRLSMSGASPSAGSHALSPSMPPRRPSLSGVERDPHGPLGRRGSLNSAYPETGSLSSHPSAAASICMQLASGHSRNTDVGVQPNRPSNLGGPFRRGV